MNIGMISKRYAKALLKYSIEMKVEDKVADEMQHLINTYFLLPQFSRVLLNPTISDKKRFLLLVTACGKKDVVCEPTRRFINIVLSNRRSSSMLYIAHSFLLLFNKHKKIQRGALTVAASIDSALEERMRKIVQHRTHSEVEMEVKVDPAIEGGFILEYDTYQLDASLRSQIKRIYNGFASLNQSSNNQV